jgi:hypothetical protein
MVVNRDDSVARLPGSAIFDINPLILMASSGANSSAGDLPLLFSNCLLSARLACRSSCAAHVALDLDERVVSRVALKRALTPRPAYHVPKFPRGMPRPL